MLLFGLARCRSLYASGSRALDSFASLAFGVGHEEQPVPEVRRASARSRQNRRPDGVAAALQSIRHKVEPSVANRSINLLSKNDWRAALLDEPLPCGPQMAAVVRAFRLSRNAEGLAGA
jgi:hypothetical protein